MIRFLYLLNLALKRPGKAIKYLEYSVFSIFGTKKYTSFILSSRSRSGSNLLRERLNSYTEVRVDGEELNWSRSRSIPRVIRRIFGRQPSWIRAKGFKLFYYHPNDRCCTEVWVELSKIHNLVIIDLVRENILEVMSWSGNFWL